MPGSNEDFLFAVFETQRLLRLYADKMVRDYGLTRAQWAVLAKLERQQGLKQAEVAEAMEMQPITLCRLVDKLCAQDLIERRSDATDRRVKRLYLTETAQPLMTKLAGLRAEITKTALTDFNSGSVQLLVAHLEAVKDNLRNALQSAAADAKIEESVDG